jgi:hypothetical protein
MSVVAMPGVLGVILSFASCVAAVAETPECVALKTTTIPFACFNT